MKRSRFEIHSLTVSVLIVAGALAVSAATQARQDEIAELAWSRNCNPEARTSR